MASHRVSLAAARLAERVRITDGPITKLTNLLSALGLLYELEGGL